VTEVLLTREVMQHLALTQPWARDLDSFRAAAAAIRAATGAKPGCSTCGSTPVASGALSEVVYRTIISSAAFRREIGVIKAMLRAQILVIPRAGGQDRL